MAGVDDMVVYMQTVLKCNTFYIHHQIVHTSHFPIFFKPKPGGGVYLWGPHVNPGGRAQRRAAKYKKK